MNLRTYLYFAFKIKDGLFIGDVNSPNVRNIINFANKIHLTLKGERFLELE